MIVVLIPAFNEERALAQLLPRMPRRVNRHAVETIRGVGFDALVLMDGDGQHDPSDLADLTRPVLEGTADLVIGSHYLYNPGREIAPWNRYAVRCASNILLRRLLPFRVTDPYSRLRAMAPHAVSSIESRGDRYESELEMLFSIKRYGLRVEEIPIRKVYGPDMSKMGSRYDPFNGRAPEPEPDPDLFYTMFWRMFDETPASMIQSFAIPLRRILAEKIFRHCGEGVIFHHNVLFSKGSNISIGDHSFINRNVMLDDRAELSIGSFVLVAAGVTIETHTHPFDDFSAPIAGGVPAKEIKQYLPPCAGPVWAPPDGRPAGV